MAFEFGDLLGLPIIADDEVLFFQVQNRLPLFIGHIDLDELQGHGDFVSGSGLLLRCLFRTDPGKTLARTPGGQSASLKERQAKGERGGDPEDILLQTGSPRLFYRS
jgi:hypothetical protein